jgi:tetratricopeptide (TPR) repeat protein
MAKRKPARPVVSPPRRRSPEWLPHVVALTVLAIALYANGIGNGFVGDDQIQLLKNPLVTSIDNIPRILGSSVWSFLGIRGNYYRPLQFLIYLLLYECAGFHAAAFHLFMVLLHAANTVLMYFLVRRLAKGRVALGAAALFAVHPIHTEAIDWIAALPDLMLTTLALSAILWFARQDGAPRGFRVVGHCGLYLLALLTKETGVMLLPLYAGFGFFCLGRGWRELRRNAALYAAMAGTLGIYLAMRVNALGGLVPGQQSFFHLKPAEFALSVVVTAARYLGALLFPSNLNYFHIFHLTLGLTAGFLASAVALGAVAAVFFRARSAPVSYGIFWMAATLAPALNLTGVGQNVFAERYLYLPSAGFCWIAACAWDWLAKRQPQWAKVAAAAVLLACAAEAVERNRDWRDDFTLLQVTVRQSPGSGWVRDTLAGVYVERDAFDKALDEERQAVQDEPRWAIFRRKLGYLLLPKDPNAAAAEFQKAIELDPSAAQSYCDLGLAFETAGEPKRAAAEYAKALHLAPQLQEAREGYDRVTPKPR